MGPGFSGRALLACAALLVAGVLWAGESAPVPEGELLRLTDDPPVVFHRSGWGWANTSSPVILTPDTILNAMIMIGRWKQGTHMPDGREVPAILNEEGLRSFIEASLRSQRSEKTSEEEVLREEIGDREAVIARYRKEGKPNAMFAFAFADHLVYLVLIAKDDDYFERGMRVARGVVESMATAVTPVCADCTAQGGTLDPGSGLCLPSAIPGLTAASYAPEERSRLAAYRHSVVAGYDAANPRLTITVFAYDRDGSRREDDRRELKAAVAEILAAHPGATLKRAFLEPSYRFGRYVEVNEAEFSWREDGISYVSGLWVVPVDARQLKVRATVPASGMSEAQARKLAGSRVREILERVCTTR